ncbi:MAG: glycosyltransferase family 2 protein [Bacillota bacterium]|jgi:glycosyltransferase involved in cell wall biosynthesis
MLSIVVIGKNESDNLPLVIASLKKLRKQARFQNQMIYVDSDSSDLSVEIARSFFDEVYVLSSSDNLCASAGRYVGTLKAIYEWILYLDGDMEVCSEFIDFICEHLEQLNTNYGYVGSYIYYYIDNTIRENALNYKHDGQVVTHHGGAVLLPRTAVIQAGNWNPCIFSNEEIDLYTRLRNCGYAVVFVNIPMIRHYTERITKISTLIRCFIPSARLGKKFYGFGQLLKSRYLNNDIYSLIRFFPYPFVYWICLIIAIFIAWIGYSMYALIPLVFGITFTVKYKGYQYIALYTAFIVQALMGIGKYEKDYIPIIKNEYIKSNLYLEMNKLESKRLV